MEQRCGDCVHLSGCPEIGWAPVGWCDEIAREAGLIRPFVFTGAWFKNTHPMPLCTHDCAGCGKFQRRQEGRHE